MRNLIPTFAALALAGCTAHVEGPTQDPQFGRALRQNLAAQVADPTPQYVREEEPGHNGPRTALAQRRYQTGTVIQPVTSGTTTIRSTSGSGSGGGN